MKKICRNCGAKVPKKSDICKKCGEPYEYIDLICLFSFPYLSDFYR